MTNPELLTLDQFNEKFQFENGETKNSNEIQPSYEDCQRGLSIDIVTKDGDKEPSIRCRIKGSKKALIRMITASLTQHDIAFELFKEVYDFRCDVDGGEIGVEDLIFKYRNKESETIGEVYSRGVEKLLKTGDPVYLEMIEMDVLKDDEEIEKMTFNRINGLSSIIVAILVFESLRNKELSDLLAVSMNNAMKHRLKERNPVNGLMEMLKSMISNDLRE